MLTLIPGVSGGSENYARELVRALGRVGRHEYRLYLPTIAVDVEGLPSEVVDEYRASRSMRGRLRAMGQASAFGGSIRRRFRALAAVHFPLCASFPPGRRASAVTTALGRTAGSERGGIPARLSGQAAAVVFPSLYAGSGKPPLEAMACGCPVACSTAAALPEVCGVAARLFDPTSVEEMAAAVEEVLESPAEWGAKGLARAAEFTWEATARAHDDVYAELAA